MLKIKKVQKNSVCDELEIKPNDELIEFNGVAVQDILDYLYFDAQENFIMSVKQDDEIVDYEIEKDEDENLGLEFYDDMLEIKTCHNNCIFCFVDQMPKGFRKSLYVKDDDYRQSFLCGNYVTLTNVSDEDIKRIIRLKLSPLYVSVQATDGETRQKLLNNRFADKILSQLKQLERGGIEVHSQVVLVRGVNDGEILRKTCFDLANLKNVKTLAVVPCGITSSREGLFDIKDIDEDYAKQVCQEVRKINAELNRNFIFLADEFFIRAKIECESSEFYGDYSQLENGVGMIRLFCDEFNSVARKKTCDNTFLVLTGISSEPLICEYAKKTEEFVSGLTVYVKGVENKFFGKTVTCTGLLTGNDLLEFAKGFDKPYDCLVISSVMLKEGENIFIDGMSVDELSSKLNKPVRVCPSGGAQFFETLSSKLEEARR